MPKDLKNGMHGNDLAHISLNSTPYPMTPIIRSLEWDPVETIVRIGNDCDNSPITWADDGNLYIAYGDGRGFIPNLTEKLGLGFGIISGDPPLINGINLRSSGENKRNGKTGKKGSGMLMVEQVLYLWLFHADENGGQAQLAWSFDHSLNWTFSPWKFDALGLCTFINFGQNYDHARDNYVYAVSHDGKMADEPADRMILMRVPKNRLIEQAAYEFFVQITDGKPVWSDDFNQRGAIFEHPDACLRSGISYHAPTKRYLWWQQIPNEPGHEDRGDTRFSGGFGIYDASEPWGPWTTVYYTRQWDVGSGERAEFPVKWMDKDGKTLYLAFSGDDNFSVRKANLELF